MMHGGMNIFLMKLKDMIQSDNGFLIKSFTLILCGLIVLVAFFSVRSWEQEYLQNQPRVVIFSAYDEYVDKVSAVLVKSKTDNARLTEVICDAIKCSSFEKVA